jgi:hypothetical protein
MRANRILDQLEALLKLSGMLAVFGYISLRTHLNYLGISNEDSLSFERYLMETWLWVTTTFELLFRPMVLALVIIAMLLTWFLRRTKTFHVRWIRHSWVTYAISSALIVATCLVQLWIRRRGSDLVVGILQGDKFDQFGLDNNGAIEDSGAVLVYWCLCMLCLLAYAFLKVVQPLNRGAGEADSSARRFALVALFILSLHVPLVFAESCHSMSYPTVTIETTDKPQQRYQGLLVLSSNDTKTLWRCTRDSKPAAETMLISNKQISRVEIGSVVDIRKEALCAIKPEQCKSALP